MNPKTSTAPQEPDKQPPSPTDHLVDQIAAEHRTQPDDIDADGPLEEPLTVANEPKGLKKLLKSKKLWFTIIFVLVVTLILLWLIRPTRIAMVNMIGLKGELSITTTTKTEAGRKSAAIKNVKVLLNGVEHHTGDDGVLRTPLPYGSVHIEVQKPGYEIPSQDVLLDFDPFFYALGGHEQDQTARQVTLQLASVGIPLSFMAKDWLTTQPITTGTFIAGDVVARPNDQGEVSFTIPAIDAKTIKVAARFDGDYTNKTVSLALDQSTQEVLYAPAGKDYFMSNRSGNYAVYSANLDGSNVAELITPSPDETGDIAFTASPSGDYGILASTRDGKRDSRGMLLQQLYLYNVETKSLTAYDQAQRFTFVDWSGDTLVYVADAYNTTTGQTTRRLASYNAANGTRADIHTNMRTFIAGRVSLNSVVYLARTNDDANPELRVARITGQDDKNLGFNIPRITQSAYDRIAYQTADQQWHEYNANTGSIDNIATPASMQRAFLASISADGQNRLLADRIDGTLALLTQKVADGTETKAYTNNSIGGPARWVGNVIVFSMDSAHYAVPASGGEPKKITDVSIPSTQTEDYFGFH